MKNKKEKTKTKTNQTKQKNSNTYINKNGYPAFKGSRIPVHRTVASNMLGRELRPGEEVHHKDRNKRNFRKSNLKVFPNRRAHLREHLRSLFKRGKW